MNKKFSSEAYFKDADNLYAAIAKWLSSLNVRGLPKTYEELVRKNEEVFRFKIENGVSTISLFGNNTVVNINSDGTVEKIENSGKDSMLLASTVAEKWPLMKVKIAFIVKEKRKELDNECSSLGLNNISFILNTKDLWQ